MNEIKKEHKGLYLCPPYNHGIQQNISEESDTSSKERKEK